ncbi:MAG: nickel pincer cofactor biosynthesis protein LarC [Gemmataceae bacterium]
MRVAHFDCFSGISGDMVLGAVIDAGVPVETIVQAIDSLGLPVKLEVERVKRCGIAATKVNVIAEDQEDYRFLPDVEAIVDRGALTDRQRMFAMKVFRCVAEAEATVHGMPVERVHFHEVGAIDSIVDIVGAAVGLDWLGVEKLTSSSVAVGSGTVKCAHGIMPVPAPATALILKGVPIAACTVNGELATPTGAAILKCAVHEFTSPTMIAESIGYGAGTKDPFEQPNVLRLTVGTSATQKSSNPKEQDSVVVLETNLDDCPGEIIGYTMERLFAAGALDVFTVPIQMKKSRPGTLLTVLADAANPAVIDQLESILFTETSTFGIRRTTATRSKLQRERDTIDSLWGPIQIKRGWRGSLQIVTPEYEDCARIARENGVPLRVVYETVRRIAEAK